MLVSEDRHREHHGHVINIERRLVPSLTIRVVVRDPLVEESVSSPDVRVLRHLLYDRMSSVLVNKLGKLLLLIVGCRDWPPETHDACNRTTSYWAAIE